MMLNLALDLNIASISNISISHRSLNNGSAHNFPKLFLVKAYIVTRKCDIVYLSETYLHSITTSDDNNLENSGYNLMQSDHTSSD